MLETGTRLTPAINLYEAMRYARIPLFGDTLVAAVLRQITCVNDTTPEWSPSIFRGFSATAQRTSWLQWVARLPSVVSFTSGPQPHPDFIDLFG